MEEQSDETKCGFSKSTRIRIKAYLMAVILPEILKQIREITQQIEINHLTQYVDHLFEFI